MFVRVKQTIVNLKEIQSIHFDDDNARISVVFNATNINSYKCRFDFFDEDNATEEDWIEYSKAVERICNGAKTFVSTKNPFA